MYTLIRTYTGADAKKRADLLMEHKAEVEGLLRGVAGLVNYTAARTAEWEKFRLEAESKLVE